MAVQVTNNSSTVVVKAAGIQGPQGPAGADADTSALASTGSNSFTGDQIISGSLTVSGSSTFTNIGPAIFSGSVTVTEGITGSFSGTATSASFAVTASYALFAVSASHEITFEVSSSFAITAQTSSNSAITHGVTDNNQYLTTIANSTDAVQPIQRPTAPILYSPSTTNPITNASDKAAEFQLGLNNQAGGIFLTSNLLSDNPNYIRTLNQDLYLKVKSAGTGKLFISASAGIETTGHITASGDISASGEMVANSLRVENRASGITADVIISGSTFDGDSRDAQIIYPSHGLHFNADSGNYNHVLALASNKVGVRIQPDVGNAALTVSGSINVIDGDIFGVTNITASGNISASGDLFARDITANDITLDALGISDKPNVILKRGSVTGAELKMNDGGNDNGIFLVNDLSGLQSIRLEGGGNSFFSQSLNVGVPYAYPEPVGGTFTVRGTISSSGAFNTLSHITASGNISASGDIVTNALTASGLNYPTVDGENGDVIQTDGAGNLSFGRTRIYAQVKNVSGGVLPKGIPVHVTSSVGNLDEVIAASASDASTMPATFILAQQLNDEEEGLGILTGFINGVNTSGFNEGDVVYVAPNGGYTNQKPSGSNLIQNLGIVTKVDVNGSGFIYGAGRSNDVPNLLSGQIFFGSGSDQAQQIHISGALDQTVINNITASGNISASGDVSGVTGSFSHLVGNSLITVTGPTTLNGLTSLVASEGSNLTLEVNESASFEFLTGAANSGSFIVQTSPDTGKGFLQSYFGQGTGTVFGQPVPNQAFGITYTSGSGASEGELTMVIGKRDLSSLGLANQNNFYVAYEPSGVFTNAQGELEFYVGEHGDVGTGVLSVFRGGASGATQTSSFAGYFSASAFPNQQQYTRPFAISATSTVDDSNPAFVINKNVTDLTTSNFSVDYGGNVAASGNISASGQFIGDGSGLTNLQRPITTHTANFSASAVYAGNFNIVGGSLTCSISTSAAAVGAEWEFFQTSSAGNFLFQTGSGITLYSKDGNVKLAGQSSAATLKKISADSFALIGDLTS